MNTRTRTAQESKDPARIREVVEEVARTRRRMERMPLASLDGFEWLRADTQARFLHDLSWLRRWLKRVSLVLTQKEG